MNGLDESPMSSGRMTSSTTTDNTSMSHLLAPSVPTSNERVTECCDCYGCSPIGLGLFSPGNLFPSPGKNTHRDVHSERDDILMYAQTPTRSPGMAGSALSPPNTVSIKHENSVLQSRLRQLQQDLQIEQDMVATLRKKMNSTERERLNSSAKSNEEISRLDAELTKTRAQLEKGEAVRQNLEFELAKWRKDLTQEKRSFSERENLLTEVNEKMKDKIAELSHQIEQMCRQLEREKSSYQEEINRLRFSIEEKERAVSHGRTEKDIIEAEKDKVESALHQQERTVQDLEEKLRELDDEKRNQTDSFRKQVNENELLREKEERTRKELEMSIQRVKQLEESVEAERAAHLESKFNSEIVQLRIRDLESALNIEKSSKTDAVETIEKLNKQIRDLQSAFAEERHESAESKSQLEKAEKEYAILSQKLGEELDAKKSIIKKLSKQLELHQGNFNDLKDELNKAKKRQIYLEETYSGSMRELELLVTAFSTETMTTAKKTKVQSKKKDGPAKLPSPSSILENLRHTLTFYRGRSDNLTTEVEKLKTNNERVTKELEAYKNQMWAKDKALEDTQQAVTRTSKQLRRIQNEGSNVDKRLQQAEGDLRIVSKELEKERNEHKELSNQMVTVATKYKADEKAKLDFAHQLYQQLLTGRLLKQSQEGSTLGSFSWTDLTVLINEQVSLLLNTLNRSEEKVNYLESTLETKESTIGQIQVSHDHMLSKIASAAEGQTLTWQQQKAEMEEHYAQLLAEVHARHKKGQSLSDQAWEKVRSMGIVQQSLETECTELKVQFDQSESEKTSLLYACSMLAGALCPLISRCESLGLQRNILMQQVQNFACFKQQIATLVNTLKMDDKETSAKRGSPLVRFRVTVMAVMAANRLAHWSLNSKVAFTASVAQTHINIPISTGQTLTETTEFKGISEPWLLGQHSQDDNTMLPWLHNNELLSVITSTMSDLQGAISQNNEQDKEIDAKLLSNLMRSCFGKLTSQLIGSYPANQHATYNDRSSLVKRLQLGINSITDYASLENTSDIVSSKKIAGELQFSVLDFTKRLHTVEVERRDLRADLNRLRSEQHKQTIEEQNELQQQLDNMVPRENLDQVCMELDHALRREQRAQQLLREQSQQLNHLGNRVDLHTTLELEKDANLTDAVQGLSEAKLELKRKEATVRQLNRQVQHVEKEKDILQCKVDDAENALRTAIKDRDVLTKYINNVECALEGSQTKALLSTTPGALDLSPLLAKDMVPGGTSKCGPHVIACQGLVAAFVATQQMLNSKISSLQEEILDHKQHINTLKKEFSEAYKREYDGEVDLKLLNIVSPQKPYEFAPLIEDQESFGVPSRAVPSRKKGSQISQSSTYATPRHARSRAANSKHSN